MLAKSSTINPLYSSCLFLVNPRRMREGYGTWFASWFVIHSLTLGAYARGLRYLVCHSLPWARRRRRVKRLSVSVCMYVYMCVYKKQGRLVFVDWDLPYNTSLQLC